MTNLPNLNNGKNSFSTIKAFISNFVSADFFSTIVNIALYPAEIGATITAQSISTIGYIKKFFKDLEKECQRLNIPNTKQIRDFTNVTNTILSIRESNAIINYKNVFQHLPQLNLPQQQMVQHAIQNKFNDNEVFRKAINELLVSVQAYYEVQSISQSIVMLDSFHDYATRPDVSVFEAVKTYRETVISLYNDISQLHLLNKADDSDYFIINDEESTKTLAETLVNYLKTGYSFLKTGIDLFDKWIEGFESSSVHLITAPSNHGKSIFLVNLARTIALSNINDFAPEDTIMFVTMEDDIYKLARRFMSIFGNIEQKSVKRLYSRAADVLKANALYSKDEHLDNKVKMVFQNLLIKTIQKVTNGKFNLIIAHTSENTYSPGDISKAVDREKLKGRKVKMIFLDYVDTMTPTIQKYTSGDDYDTHGLIVQELRTLSRHHKIPVITATQNKRESESMNYAMSNTMIGDSYKKVRYSDFIYMCRMRRDLSVFDDSVKKYVIPPELYSGVDQLSEALLRMKDRICENLIPYEIKITKSKDAGRDESTFTLFCKQNLRIYNNLSEYLNDIARLENSTKSLDRDVNTLTDITMSFNNENFVDENLGKVIPFVSNE